jgi:heme/copper-type cytochrome/quinol oxidase subunit 3
VSESSSPERPVARLTTAELQAADRMPANVAVGIRLWAGATVFFFLGPFFAYLYLRSLNSADLWRPAGIDPPQELGAAIMALTVTSSLALVLAAWAFDSPARGRWVPLGGVSLTLGLAAVVLQIVEYARLGFGPTDGGYASVFVAWTGLTALFVLATMLSLEMLVAYGLRSRRQTSPPDDDPHSPVALIRPRLVGLAFYWAFLASLAVVMWIVLYLV